MTEVLIITIHLPTKVVVVGDDDVLAVAFLNLFKSNAVAEAVLKSAGQELCEVANISASLQKSFNKDVQLIPCCSVHFPESEVSEPPMFFFESEEDKNWFLRKYLGSNLENVVESTPITH